MFFRPKSSPITRSADVRLRITVVENRISMETGRSSASSVNLGLASGAALFLRIGSVMRMTGLGRSTIYRLMADEQFPHPVRLTKRVVAWRHADLERWSDERVSATH